LNDDRASENDVALSVARAYYTAVASNQLLRAVARSKGVAEENARIAQVRLNEGAATPMVVDRAKVEVARAELLSIEAKRNWEAARRALSSASGLPEPAALVTPAPLIDSAPSEESLLSLAE